MKNKLEQDDFIKNTIPRRSLTDKANARFEASYRMLGVQQETACKTFKARRIWATVTACAVLVCGMTVAFPVFAEYMPTIGRAITGNTDSFKAGNVRGKFIAGTNVGTYPVQHITAETAVSESNGYKLTVDSAYSDGTLLTFSWKLQAPEGTGGLYESLGSPELVATVDGADASLVNPPGLYPDSDTVFTDTGVIKLPQALENGAISQITLSIPSLIGKDKTAKSNFVPIEQSFKLSFPVTIDTSANKAFSFDAAIDNDVQLTQAKFSPMQTLLTLTAKLPTAATVEVEPVLLLEDGTELKFTLRASMDSGFDPSATTLDNATMVFDGVPAGTEKVIFRIYKNRQHDSVVSEFTISPNDGSAIPTTTYLETGALNIDSPFNYEHISSPYSDDSSHLKDNFTNEFIVDDMYYSVSRPQLCMALRTTGDYKEIKVEAFTADGVSIGSTVSQYGTKYENENWYWDETSPFWDGFSASRQGENTPHAYRLYITPEGYQPAWNETLTLKVTDNATGEEIVTQDLTFTEKSF